MLWIPPEVRSAAGILRAAGRQAYLVGGALRDGLLGLSPKDWDLATDAPPSEVSALFAGRGYRVLPTGWRFGTVTVVVGQFSLEVTTFRAEGRYSDYRRPDYVRFGSDIIQDLARRDFTVNALALDLAAGRVVDPFGGRKDLRAGLIRTVGRPSERFREDPLRMLRGFRLAAERGLVLEGATRLSAAVHAELLLRVARERIREELARLLTGHWAAAALEDLAATGLLFVLIPELWEGWAFPQPHRAHTRSVLDHLLETVRYTPPLAPLRLAALLHDVAKPRCFALGPDGSAHFFGHDRLGARLAVEILQRLRWDRRTCETVAVLIRHHMFPLAMGDRGIRRLVLRVGSDRMEELLALRQADVLATGAQAALQAEAALASFRTRLKGIMERGEVLGIGDLAVDGHDVMRIAGLSPGPEVGRILRALHQEVVADPSRNSRAYLEPRIADLAGRNSLPPGEYPSRD